MWLGSKRHWDKFLIHGGICVFPLQAARQVPVAQGLAVFRIRHVVHNLLLFVVHHLVTSISLTDGRTRRWRGSWNTGYFRRLGMRGGRGDRRGESKTSGFTCSLAAHSATILSITASAGMPRWPLYLLVTKFASA
jgi:hypothetical protein